LRIGFKYITVFIDPYALAVFACEHAAAGWDTKGVLTICLPEVDTLLCKPVKVGCIDCLISLTPENLGFVLISKKENNIGPRIHNET
jgi:hypothetical protein